MKSREVEINEIHPFANCKLKRRPYAEVLTSIIESYPQGFVLAVDGSWGTGKSTFMKMWRQDLTNSGFNTVMFNAWENDFISDPTIAVLGEIRKIFNDGNSQTLQNVIDKIAKVSSKAIPTMTKAILKIAGMGALADTADVVMKAALEEFDNEIKDYDNKKNSLIEIRRDLSQFLKECSGDKPLIFIVDELDRCRPDYAVEVLEKIKHFFAVEGIIFVLSIDKKQLCNSICGYYGSDKIDSDEYLRRFIDIEYKLPEPEYKDYLKYLFEIYRLGDYYKLPKRYNSYELRFNEEQYYSFMSEYCKAKGISLRQLEKIFAHTRIVTNIFNTGEYANPILVTYLITIKCINPL